MRRTLIIISVVVVALGLAIFVYFKFFSSKPNLGVEQNPTLPDSGAAQNSGTPPEGDTGGQNTTSNTNTGSGAPVRLLMIDQGPVVPGELVLDTGPAAASTTGTSTPQAQGVDIQTFYIKRESGNVYSYLTSTGIGTRTSNRTLPGIQEAAWLSNGAAAVVRYLSGPDSRAINTYLLPTDGTSGSFLPQNLSGVATASSTILTVASGVNGSLGSIEGAAGTQIGQAFTTPLSSIRASFAGKGQYLVFTKPNSDLPGYAFLVDGKNAFSQIAGPLNGLVALASPKGTWTLVSYVANGSMKLELVQNTTHEAVALPIGTITDKCVWAADESAAYCGVPVDPAADATYPDDWYQGAAHFSDRIWKIDVSGRFAQLVLDFPGETKKTLDAVALAIDPSGKQLVFMNKNDASLWKYQF